MSTRSNRSAGRRFVQVSLPACVAIIPLGCADGPQPGSQSMLQPEPAIAPIGDEVAFTQPDEDAMAAQLQRDIDAFLLRRESRVDDPVAQDDAGAAASSGAPITRTRAPVEWNTPSRPEAAPSDAEPGPDTAVLAMPEAGLAIGGSPASDALDSSEEQVGTLLVDLSRALRAEAAYAEMPLRELLLIAATRLVRPDWELSDDLFNDLTDREQDVLRKFHAFFASLGESLDGRRDLDAVLEAELTELRASLRIDPNLNIPVASLCTRVAGFGDYDAFPKNGEDRYVFLASRDQQAIVYIEVENFTSAVNGQDEWITELSQQVSIYGPDGTVVWGGSGDWQAAVDKSRNQRTDYFTVQVITLPKQLSVGRYHLKVRLRDEKSRAEAETSMTFEMVADARLARSLQPDP